MGTAKRERQKANRALKQNELVKADQRRRGTRIAVIVAGALAAVVGLVWIGSQFTSDGGEDEPVIEPNLFDDSGTDPGESDAPDATTDTETDPETEPVTAAEVDCPPVDGSAEQIRSFSGPPPDCLEPGATYSAVVTTSAGEFTIDLDQSKAPQAVNSFVFLARYKYFDDTVCHRIIPGFVVQCGDPTGTGTGGPGYRFPDELPAAGEYQIGSVAMANSGPDTNGSQFFIITGDDGAGLPPQYSLFGEVSTGFDDTVVEMEAAGTVGGAPSEDVEIIGVEIIQG